MKLFKTLFFVSILFIISCNGGSGSSPGEVYKSTMINLEKGDYDKAFENFTKSGGTEFSSQEKEDVLEFLKNLNEIIKQSEGWKTIDILDETVSDDGNSATVKIHLEFNNGETSDDSIELIKVDGDWKIELKF